MRTERAQGYAQPMPPGTVFALSEPDDDPLPPLTRVQIEWQGAEWREEYFLRHPGHAQPGQTRDGRNSHDITG